MKRKIIGTFVCMLLITTALPVLGSLNANKFQAESSIQSETFVESEMQLITITRPKSRNLYLFDTIVLPFPSARPIIIGPITFQCQAQPNVAWVDYYLTDMSGNLLSPDWPYAGPPNFAFYYSNVHGFPSPPFLPMRFIIYAEALDSGGNLLGTTSVNAFKIL